MRAKVWLESFFKHLNEIDDKELDDQLPSGRWTEIVSQVMDKIGEGLYCGVAGRKSDTSRQEESEEYLTIDFMFFNKKDYNEDKSVLPLAVVEHENNPTPKKIEYCLWKILCVRSSLRVLICYQPDANKIESLRRYLEVCLWEGNLMKGDNGDLLIIIGDESIDNKKDSEWDEYFQVFEWRSDSLKVSKMVI